MRDPLRRQTLDLVAQQRAAWEAQRLAQPALAAQGCPMPDPVCELCGDATPPALVRSDPARGWDTLCPACWMVNAPEEPPAPGAVELEAAWAVLRAHIGPAFDARLAHYHAELAASQAEGQRGMADFQRAYNARLSALAESMSLAERSPYAVRVAPEA
jgi:hypothetical protein